MNRWWAGLGCLVALLGADIAVAQETIVVTGSRVEEDRSAMPYVTRAVRADFVIGEVTCQSASLDRSERERELRATYMSMLAGAKADPELTISGGELGFSTIPVDTLKFSDVHGRGTSLDSFRLLLTGDTRPQDLFETTFGRMEAFVRGVSKSGRVECYLDDEQMIGIRKAQERRSDLLNDIAAEVEKMQVRFKAAEIKISGLESAVQTLASGPLEVTIYLPYSLEVSVGRGAVG